MRTMDREHTENVMKILKITSKEEFETLIEYIFLLLEPKTAKSNSIQEKLPILSNYRRQPSEREKLLYNINALATHFEFIRETWRHQLYPSLKAVDSPVAGKLYDRFTDGSVFLMAIKRSAEAQLLPGEEPRID